MATYSKDGYMTPIERTRVTPDFILYEKPSATFANRVVVPINPANKAKYSKLKIGLLVDSDCLPLTFKVAADVKDKVSGISLVEYSPVTGLTTAGETELVYLTSGKAEVLLKDNELIAGIIDNQTDPTVTDAKVIQAIYEEVIAEIERLGFEFVACGF